MKQFINKIVASLDNHTKGFSARKLSAFVVVICIVSAHIKWFNSDKWEYLGEVLALDYGFIAVCLGMTTWESIKTKTNATANEQA